METKTQEKRKRRAITKELIEEFLGSGHRISRTLWGWKVDLKSGASFTLTKKKLDFGRFRELENRKDVREPLFQMEVEDCLLLGEAIWGGVNFSGAADSKDYAEVLEYAQSEGINTGDQGLTFRHFGADATIKYGWLSYTISVPNKGYVKVDCGAIEKVVGDLMAPALAMLHEIAPDRVVVRGKPDLLIAAFHCGNAMGIAVIPEDQPNVFIVLTSNGVVLLCGAIAFQWVDFVYAVLIGYVAGFSLWMLAWRLFWKQLRDVSRRRGLDIVKPEHFSKSRKASENEARKMGML
jgi:hypothetical protein